MEYLKERLELELAEAELEAKNILDGMPGFVKFLLIFSILAVIPSFFIAKSISLGYYNKQYQSGLASAHTSFTNPKPLKFGSAVFVPGQPFGTAVVTVTNENLDLSLNQAPLKIHFYDSANREIYTWQDKVYLLPNQTKTIVVTRIPGPGAASKATYEVPEELAWQKRLFIPTVKLVPNTPTGAVQLNPPQYAVQGEVLNNSPYQVGSIRIIILLKNASGTVIGASQRDEFTLAPFTRRAYKQLWPGVLDSSGVAKIEAFAETNTLDPLNLTLPAGSNTPSSDLGRPEAQPQW